MLTRTLPAALLCLSLTACGSNPPRDPVIQRVETVRYVPVPAVLTQPCEVERAQRTVGEALENGVALRACVDALNGRMESIRGLGNPPF
jgi:hypothetical protein